MSANEKTPVEQFAEFYGLTPEMVQQIMDVGQDLAYFNLQNAMLEVEEMEQQAKVDAAVQEFWDAVGDSPPCQVIDWLVDVMSGLLSRLSRLISK